MCIFKNIDTTVCTHIFGYIVTKQKQNSIVFKFDCLISFCICFDFENEWSWLVAVKLDIATKFHLNAVVEVLT